MEVIKCRHCGTLNGSGSRFCENCGKKIPKKPSNTDGIGFLIILLVAGAICAYGYYAGYRISDVPGVVKAYISGQTPPPPSGNRQQKKQEAPKPAPAAKTLPSPKSFKGDAPAAPAKAPAVPAPVAPAAPAPAPAPVTPEPMPTPNVL